MRVDVVVGRIRVARIRRVVFVEIIDVEFLGDHVVRVDRVGVGRRPEQLPGPIPYWTATLVVLAYVVYNVVYAALSYPAGSLSDRVPRGLLLVAGYVVLGGPGVPTSTTPTGEPNETAQQAAGPLSGDIVYTGSLDTSNDEDWFAFWANAAFTVTTTATGGNCSTSLTVFDSDVDYVGGTSASENLIRHFSHTPDGWQLFYLRAEANCVGAGYRFSLSPASAIPLVGPPAPTAPAALPGIGKRKTRTTVVAYWGVANGATSYQVRLHRKHSNSRWKSTSNAWFSIKKHGLRKKTWLQVRAVNGVGPGPIASIRLK